jgi:hypothetical protein
MRHPIVLSLLFACNASAAETPRQLLYMYAAEAAGSIPGFEPNAGLGEHLYTRKLAPAHRMASCTTCHTTSPLRAQLQIDPARVERRLARDCMAVLGRHCSAGEKADLLAYLTAAN